MIQFKGLSLDRRVFIFTNAIFDCVYSASELGDECFIEESPFSSSLSEFLKSGWFFSVLVSLLRFSSYSLVLLFKKTIF